MKVTAEKVFSFIFLFIYLYKISPLYSQDLFNHYFRRKISIVFFEQTVSRTSSGHLGMKPSGCIWNDPPNELRKVESFSQTLVHSKHTCK